MKKAYYIERIADMIISATNTAIFTQKLAMRLCFVAT